MNTTANMGDVRARQQTAVAELGQLALLAGDLGQLLQRVAAMVAQQLDADYSAIFDLTSDGHELILTVGVGWKDGVVGAVQMPATLESPIGYALHAKVPVIIEDLRRAERFTTPRLLEEHGVRSGITVAIESRSEPVGVLAAFSRRTREHSQYDAALLQAVANIVAESMSRKRIEGLLREHNNELQARNNLMMAREARILELKQEINDLLAALGRPPRYGV